MYVNVCLCMYLPQRIRKDVCVHALESVQPVALQTLSRNVRYHTQSISPYTGTPLAYIRTRLRADSQLENNFPFSFEICFRANL